MKNKLYSIRKYQFRTIVIKQIWFTEHANTVLPPEQYIRYKNANSNFQSYTLNNILVYFKNRKNK